MSSRLALESWQLLYPAIGLGIFAAIFCVVVFRVWRMKPPRAEHMGHLPLEEERCARAVAGRPRACAGSPGSSTPVTTKQDRLPTNVR